MISNVEGAGAVLLSGGLDSSILIGMLLRRGETVQPLYVRSSLNWEDGELAAARSFLTSISSIGGVLRPMRVLRQPVDDLYQDHWSVTGKNVPDLASADEAVHLPGRNMMLVTKAALWCQLNGIGRLSLAPLATSPFSDASDDFFQSLEAAVNKSGPPVAIERPFAGLSKRDVMRLGEDLPLELTFSCLAPREHVHCGSCNKCAERRQAFLAAGKEDPTHYLSGAVVS